MAFVNFEGYVVCHKGVSHYPKNILNKPQIIWKIKEAHGEGKVSLCDIYFPKEMINKKIKIKIEFIS